MPVLCKQCREPTTHQSEPATCQRFPGCVFPKLNWRPDLVTSFWDVWRGSDEKDRPHCVHCGSDIGNHAMRTTMCYAKSVYTKNVETFYSIEAAWFIERKTNASS